MLLHVAGWSGVSWWVAPFSQSPFLSLTALLRCLRGAVGGWGGLGLLDAVLTLLLYRRLGGVCRDFERLAARFQAGRLWRRLDVGRRVAVGAEQRAVAARVWPWRFGWLVRAAGYRAAAYREQMLEILGQPEMVELLMAAPQAARILRPVCRMLALEMSLLRPGVVVAVVAAEVGDAAPKRVRGARKIVEWGRIALPRGVLAAARRQGFRKGG